MRFACLYTVIPLGSNICIDFRSSCFRISATERMHRPIHRVTERDFHLEKQIPESLETVSLFCHYF